MEVKIYKRNGEVALSAIVDDSSQWNCEVGVENVVTLNFTTWEFVVLEAGARIEIAGEVFKLKSEYRPKHINNSKYSYSVQFHGREHDAEELLFCRLNQGEEDLESVFQYEGTPAELLAKVVENLNRNTDGVTWEAGEAIVASRQSMNFNGVYCWEALAQIAEAFKTEWWRDGNRVNLTKCEHGEEIALGYGAGLKSGIEQQRADNAVGFYTRLLPIGSTMNIDKEAYGHERLQLPGGVKYIDVDTDKGLKEHREEAAFSGIYPHRVGTVSMVETEEKKDEEHGDYTVYYFADKELPFDPEECMLPGKMINVRFTTGELAGKDFEVNWQKSVERFEIINTYPDENSQLPGGNLIPKVGDKYVLWNLAMPVQYYAAAEQEYKQAVDDFIAESKVDNAVYTAPTDYIYLDRKGAALSVGRRVKLVSDRYFDEGAKSTRITKISRKLKRLNDATIECRSAVVKSWKSSVDSSINSISYSIANELEAVMLEVLQTGEKDAPTDYNVFSALRSLSTFLRKDREDSTEFFTRFVAGLQAGQSKINEDGSAELKRVAVEGDASSAEFVSGMATGKGWAIQQKKIQNIAGEEELYTSAEVDELTVRKSLKIFEFVVSQLLGENDNRVFSGMMEVDHYDATEKKIYLKTENGKLYNTFREGDVVMVQQFAVEDVIKSYEFIVTTAEVGNLADGEKRLDTITFRKFVGGFPEELIAEGDTLVRMDSVSDETRKGLVQVTSVGANAPYIDVVKGLKTDPDNALMARLGNLDGIYDAELGDEQPEGAGLYAKNAYLRGKFVLSSGEDVKTELIAKDGLIRSVVQNLQGDEIRGKSVVYNASFTEGLEGWDAPGAGGVVKFDGQHFYLSLRNIVLTQANVYFRKSEELDGERNVDVEFALRYRTNDRGMLFVALGDCDSISMNACRGYWTGSRVAVYDNVILQTAWDSIVEFLIVDSAIGYGDRLVVTRGYRLLNLTKGVEIKYSMSYEGRTAQVRLNEKINVLAAEVLPASKEFTEYSSAGKWNGSGNLEIFYPYAIDFYAVQLYSEPTIVKYSTFFEQSAKLIKLAAKNFKADGSVNAASEIVVKPERAGLMTSDAAGNVATVGTYEDGVVKLTGEEVLLEGKVTANGNVEITPDGKLKAIDGEFSGKIEATEGTIGNFTIGEGLEYEDDTESYYKAVIDENGAEFSDTYKDSYTGGVTRSKSIKINGRFADKTEGARALQCYRTVAKDVVNNTFYETPPMVELIDGSSLPTPVLKTRGGIVQEGAFLHCYAILKLDSERSPNVLTINKGNKWLVLNTSGGERAVYFPTLSDMLKMLCLSEADDKTFAVPLSVTVAGYTNSYQSVTLYFQAEGHYIYVLGANATKIKIYINETIDLLLVNDSEMGYNAIVINRYNA